MVKNKTNLFWQGVWRTTVWCTMLLLIAGAVLGCQQTDEVVPTTTNIPPAPTLIADESVVTATPTAGSAAEEQSLYPAPASATPDSYPAASTTPDGYPPATNTAATAAPSATGDTTLYLPVVSEPLIPTATITPTPSKTPTPTPSPTPIPTIDFAAVSDQLRANGQQLAFSKIGFHIGVGGNRDGLGEWMRRHTEAGAPFFLKTVSDAGPLAEAQELIRESGVPHTLVFRTSGDEYDTPNYDLPPAEAARQHWALHLAAWPPELDPNLVWLETLNEVDKNRSEWLAEFALETAKLAERDGYKWAAFGWSSGEPEQTDWEAPKMLAFLRLAASKPDRLAIALHEYSYTVDDIADAYPYKVGRFQLLFEVADRYNIPRPTVLITEWGWEYQDNPIPSQAMEDIRWAAALYAPYPEIKGAAIWYLGPGFGEIANQTQKLITPVLVYNLTNYFAVGPNPLPIAPEQHRP